jgi:DsbC/DsbD-like thiol-disulfide interchange protein
MPSFAAAVIFALSFSISAVALDEAGPVRAELISEVQAIRPGEPFAAGVLFTMQPGWHIYWKNPGDSGLATTVDFTMPDGFSLSELCWPVPRGFERPGGMVDYGYEESVLLMAMITPAESIGPGEEFRLRVRAQWLACREVCLPGEQQAELALGVVAGGAAARASGAAGLFEQWRARLPVAEKAGAGPVKVEVQGGMPPQAREGDFRLTIRPQRGILRDVGFYPLPPEGLAIERIEVHPDPAGAIITFRASLLAGAKLEAERLEAVIGFTDADDRRRGAMIFIPLHQSDQQP